MLTKLDFESNFNNDIDHQFDKKGWYLIKYFKHNIARNKKKFDCGVFFLTETKRIR